MKTIPTNAALVIINVGHQIIFNLNYDSHKGAIESVDIMCPKTGREFSCGIYVVTNGLHLQSELDMNGTACIVASTFTKPRRFVLECTNVVEVGEDTLAVSYTVRYNKHKKTWILDTMGGLVASSH